MTWASRYLAQIPNSFLPSYTQATYMKRMTSSRVRYPNGMPMSAMFDWTSSRIWTISSTTSSLPAEPISFRISAALMTLTSVPRLQSCRNPTSFSDAPGTSMPPRYSLTFAGLNSMTFALSRTFGENSYVVSS